MRERFRRYSNDADITALRLEHFTAMLETILVFAVCYLIQQYLAAGGFFEQAMEAPGTLGKLGTNPGWIVATVAGFFALPLLIRWVSDGWKVKDFGFAPRPGRRDMTLAAYLGVVMGLWFSLTFWIRADALIDARSLLAISSWWDALFYMGYIAVFVAALRSEFFFRGYVQKLLVGEYGLSWGTLLALLFFWTSLHWIGWTHLVALLVPIGLGSALLFNRRGSVYGPLIYHALTFIIGFFGYALLELTPHEGFAFYTGALFLIVIMGLRWMRIPLLLLGRNLISLMKGLKSNWLRNTIIAFTLVVVLRILWGTAHTNLRVHTWATAAMVTVWVAYKLSVRFFDLRRVFGQ
jgi:membrane protease YdiL (CAAX protease family)